jgi:hypothetical protein
MSGDQKKTNLERGNREGDEEEAAAAEALRRSGEHKHL